MNINTSTDLLRLSLRSSVVNRAVFASGCVVVRGENRVGCSWLIREGGGGGRVSGGGGVLLYPVSVSQNSAQGGTGR